MSLVFIVIIIITVQVLPINNGTDKTAALLCPLSLALTHNSQWWFLFLQKKVEISLIYHSQNYLNV